VLAGARLPPGSAGLGGGVIFLPEAITLIRLARNVLHFGALGNTRARGFLRHFDNDFFGFHKPSYNYATESHSGQLFRFSHAEFVDECKRNKYGGIMADLMERITMEPGKCGGRPCIRGMRIRVMDILEMLSLGVSEQEILNDFPNLESDDIKACFRFAARRADFVRLSA
jgi:uncharacterized protein (DUF433 family)